MRGPDWLRPLVDRPVAGRGRPEPVVHLALERTEVDGAPGLRFVPENGAVLRPAVAPFAHSARPVLGIGADQEDRHPGQVIDGHLEGEEVILPVEAQGRLAGYGIVDEQRLAVRLLLDGLELAGGLVRPQRDPAVLGRDTGTGVEPQTQPFRGDRALLSRDDDAGDQQHQRDHREGSNEFLHCSAPFGFSRVGCSDPATGTALWPTRRRRCPGSTPHSLAAVPSAT